MADLVSMSLRLSIRILIHNTDKTKYDMYRFVYTIYRYIYIYTYYIYIYILCACVFVRTRIGVSQDVALSL